MSCLRVKIDCGKLAQYVKMMRFALKANKYGDIPVYLDKIEKVIDLSVQELKAKR